MNEEILIGPETSVRDAMRQMDHAGKKILLVVEEDRTLRGTLTDGDLRTHIIQRGTLDGTVEECMNNDPKFLRQPYSADEAKELLTRHVIDSLPVIDNDGRVVDCVFWHDLLSDSEQVQNPIDVPVVIMAGGRGTRLDPFTRILPKPLIPIGDTPMLELIMGRFHRFGVREFFLVVNYKKDMIRSYFDNAALEYKIHYIHEEEFLGTAGGLKLLPNDFPERFIVSNCDILVDTDYSGALDYHVANGNTLTLIGSMHRHVVPYGVLEFTKNGELSKIREKPEYDFTINTGCYILEKSCLNRIPENKFFHITDLIQVLIEEKKEKVGVFPVSEKSYIDIGQWDEYRKSASSLRFDG